MPVSFRTAKRHRDRAQTRLRNEQSNRSIYIPLPPPFEESLHSPSLERSPSWSSKTPGSFCESVVPDAYDSVGETEQKPETPSESSSMLYGEHDSTLSIEPSSLDDAAGAGGESGSSESTHEFPHKAWGDSIENVESIGITHSSDTHSNGQDSGLLQGWKSLELPEFMKEYSWIIGFSLRHNVTMSAMDDIIRREKKEGARAWKTIRNDVQRLSGIKITRIPYCSKSHQAFSEADYLEGRTECRCVHKDCAISPAPIREILYIGLWERLLVKLQCPEQGPILCSYVRTAYMAQVDNGFQCFEDFYSGEGFREYAQGLDGFNGSIGLDATSGLPVVHLFFFFSTDGAPAFKSTQYSFWPVLLFLANLPPSERYKEANVLPMLCIPGNPNDIESFLEPVFEELERLGKGVHCTLWDGSRALVKCHVMHVLLDLQALKKIGCLKGVSGVCPCRFCRIEGELSVSKRTYYYPDFILAEKRSREGIVKHVRRNLWDHRRLPLRDDLSLATVFQDLDELAAEGDKTRLGDLQRSSGIIREPEVCRRFKSVRPYLSMPIDLMHLLFENVAPLFLKIWLGEVDTQGEHDYLRRPVVVRQIDEILLRSATGIIDAMRAPRALNQHGSWKADEWRTFVLTTSLVALPQFLPRHVLEGWRMFCRLCELAMRPNLTLDDVDDLSVLCTAFYEQYTKVYYKGIPERLHLMRYVVHLMLHIPLSTSYCGPLVCLSQFSTERYIGVIKSSTNARYRFAESVAVTWAFQQGVQMCETMSSEQIPLRGPPVSYSKDRRSFASDRGKYEGYFLAGPCETLLVHDLSEVFGYNMVNLLGRFYQEDLKISRSAALDLVNTNSSLSIWDRLFVQKPSDSAHRKYGRWNDAKRRRSCAFFAGEFEDGEGTSVYYGKVLTFIEHCFTLSDGSSHSRILVLSRWASAGLMVGLQQQVYCGGRVVKDSVFPTTTVEDGSCMARNISVFDVKNYKSTRADSYKTFFVDEELHLDNLLGGGMGSGNHSRKRLKGLSSVASAALRRN